MHTEIRILAWAAILLLVHIVAAVAYATTQYGTRWNAGARDEAVAPLNPVAARLARARDNFLETLPLAIIALIGAVVAGRTSADTALGGWIWLGARAVYLPLYWAGIPYLRTAAFLVSIFGIMMVLRPLLWA